MPGNLTDHTNFAEVLAPATKQTAITSLISTHIGHISRPPARLHWLNGESGDPFAPEFLAASWRAGVVRYDVDLTARTVAYYGCRGEEYIENYPAVDVG